jgi:signal transduction histidine kinase
VYSAANPRKRRTDNPTLHPYDDSARRIGTRRSGGKQDAGQEHLGSGQPGRAVQGDVVLAGSSRLHARDDRAEVCQLAPGEERLAVGGGLLGRVTDDRVRRLGELARRLVSGGLLGTDGVDVRAGVDPASFDDRPLRARRQDDEVGVRHRLLGGVARSRLQLELGLGPSRERLPVLRGRAEDADLCQSPYCGDCPQLGPGLRAAADDPDGRRVRPGERIDGGASERSGSPGSELSADHAPRERAVAFPDENCLIRAVRPEPVDPEPDRPVGVAARREDERVLAEVGPESRRCGKHAAMSVDQGAARGSDRVGRVEAGANLVVEQDSHGNGSHTIRGVVQTDQDRLRAVLDAAIAVTSELSIEAVLQRIVEAAAELTGAKYAALGVIDQSGTGLENFVTTGLDEETIRRIGDLPRGRGILGVLIREAQPLRLGDIARDPRSVGFPPNHPPMKSFLGVPILLRGVAYGNLYLTEKAGGDEFTDEDEELVQLLAAQAAVAIENARLYESATRWGEQLQSLAEVGNALATEIELPRLLELVVTRLRALIDARIVFLAMPRAGDETVIETVAGESAEQYVGIKLDPTRSKSARVLERRRSERVDALIDDPEADQQTARRLGARTGLFVPLIVRDRAIGVLVAQDKQQPDPRFTDEDLRIAEAFAERAAVAIDLSERVARDALRRVVAGQELERQRLARELHDETGQALTSILLGLKGIEEGKDEEDVRRSVLALRELVVSTLQDVRRLAVELRPKALDDFGLVPALERLAETFAEQTNVTVDVEAVLGEERLEAEVETALYRIVQEALTNVIKHANARTVSVVLTRQGDRVAVVIEDDGRGFDPEEARGERLGLLGMEERIALVDGRLLVESRPGQGTTVAVEVPLR